MPLKDLFPDAPSLGNRKDNLQSNQKKDFVCSACGTKVTPEDEVCPSCGITLNNEVEPVQTNLSTQYPTIMNSSTSRYQALSTILNIYVYSAIVVAVITVLIAVIELGTGLGVLGVEGGIGSLIFVLITLATGGIIALSLFAAAETIKVFIDIEENTRKAAQAVKD